MCMLYEEDEKKEIVSVRYYNVLFYLFFKIDSDSIKKQCLIERIEAGEQLNMKQIYGWCQKQQVPVITRFRYRSDFSVWANLWNLYSYCRFKIERRKKL